MGLSSGQMAAILAGGIGGKMALVAATLTRPADATPYAALDALANSTSAPTVLTFTNCASVAGGSGYVTRVRIETDQKACVARFRLHLLHTAPAAINDNAVFTLLYADRTSRVGALDLPPLKSEDPTNSTAAYGHNITDRMPFVCDATDRNLYGLLETLDVFTPANAQTIFVELTVDQN